MKHGVFMNDHIDFFHNQSKLWIIESLHMIKEYGFYQSSFTFPSINIIYFLYLFPLVLMVRLNILKKTWYCTYLAIGFEEWIFTVLEEIFENRHQSEDMFQVDDNVDVSFCRFYILLPGKTNSNQIFSKCNELRHGE